MEIYGFVYRAINNLNEMPYIGQTTDTLIGRKGNHKTAKDTSDFHDAIQYYGFDNFRWEILKVCHNKNELNTEEPELIKQYNTLVPFGYNLRGGGNGHKHHEESKKKMSEMKKGKKASEESKKKMSESQKGKHSGPKSIETKKRMSNAAKGKKLSEEHKKNIGKSQIGHKLYLGFTGKLHSPEHKQKMSELMSGKNNPMFGKPVSDETRKKLSISGMSRIVTKETRRKLSEKLMGHTISEETKRKISESNKGKVGEKNGMYGKHHSEETKKKLSISAKKYWGKQRKNVTNHHLLKR